MKPGNLNFKKSHLVTTAVVHTSAETKTTNVDLTSLGLPDISRCLEVYLGCSSTTASVTTARVRLTSSTNLEVVTVSADATTITVNVLIVVFHWGIAQRFVTSHTTPGGGGTVSTNVTMTDVGDLSRCVYAWGGTTPATAAGGQGRIKPTSTTNMEVSSASSSGSMGMTTNCAIIKLAA